jgi:hypothetical protein
MTEDRKPNEDDLTFDDEFVVEDDALGFDDGEHHLADREPPPDPSQPDAGPRLRPAASLGESETDWLDDEEFVIDFGEEDLDPGLEVELEAAGDEGAASAAPLPGLDALFAPAAAAARDAGADETDALFVPPAEGISHSTFEGARARPDFVEDHAGWYGEDVDLADMVGEVAEEENRDEFGFEEEFGIDDDPFAIEDVEIEACDGEAAGAGSDSAARPKVGRSAPVEREVDVREAFFAGADAEPELSFDDETEAVPSFDGGEDLPQQEFDAPAAKDDAWAPLGEGESWIMGEAPEPVAEPEEQVESEASSFGMGRQDTFSFGATEGGAQAEEVFDLREDEVLDEAAEDEEYVDPIYGDVGAGIDAVQVEDEAEGEIGLVEDGYESDTAEFEEAYIDEAPQTGRVIGIGERRRSPWLRVAASLMVATSIGGAAVVALKPEWVGLGVAPAAVHRVEVARPRVDLTLPAPAPAGLEVPATEPVGGDPVVEPDPVDPDPSGGEPVVEPDPRGGEPVVEPDPRGGEPVVEPDPRGGDPVVVPDPVVVQPVPRDPIVAAPRPEYVFEPLAFGDGLEVRDALDPEDLRSQGVQDVRPGTRAFAQLRNEEIFIGVVKRVEASSVTLDLQPGEVSLERSELSALSPLATADASELVATEHGYVRLATEARLWGRIMRNATTDNVILRTDKARITIPARDVVQVSDSAKSGAALVDGEDDRWLDRLARQKLREFGGVVDGTRATQPARPPAGGR